MRRVMRRWCFAQEGDYLRRYREAYVEVLASHVMKLHTRRTHLRELGRMLVQWRSGVVALSVTRWHKKLLSSATHAQVSAGEKDMGLKELGSILRRWQNQTLARTVMAWSRGLKDSVHETAMQKLEEEKKKAIKKKKKELAKKEEEMKATQEAAEKEQKQAIKERNKALIKMEAELNKELAEKNKPKFHRVACVLIHQIFKRRIYLGMQRHMEQWKMVMMEEE